MHDVEIYKSYINLGMFRLKFMMKYGNYDYSGCEIIIKDRF